MGYCTARNTRRFTPYRPAHGSMGGCLGILGMADKLGASASPTRNAGSWRDSGRQRVVAASPAPNSILLTLLPLLRRDVIAGRIDSERHTGYMPQNGLEVDPKNIELQPKVRKFEAMVPPTMIQEHRQEPETPAPSSPHYRHSSPLLPPSLMTMHTKHTPLQSSTEAANQITNRAASSVTTVQWCQAPRVSKR